MLYKHIMEIGEELQKKNIKSITTDDLYKILRILTNSIHDKTIKVYIKLLKKAGFIQFKKYNWIIIDNKTRIENIKNEADTQAQQLKKSKILKPKDDIKSVVIETHNKEQEIKDLVNKLENKLLETKKEEMETKGIYVIWVDQYEYHVVCKQCYNNNPNKYEGKLSLDEILYYNPKNCEYCGAGLIR